MIDSSGDPSNKPFATFDLDTADIVLSDLHKQVLGRNGRVELRCRGGACVLISKAELDGLEKALEILSNTETVRLMRQEIALVAQVVSPTVAIPPVQLNGRARSLNLP